MKALLLAVLLAGCAAKPAVIYRSVELPVPERLPLPTVQPAELACLTDDTYGRLAMRQRLMEEMVKACEAAIISTTEQ